MSSIQKRSNGRWAVRWRDHDGRQRWRTFRQRAEAVDFRKRIDYELLHPSRTPRTGRTRAVALEDFYTDWFDRQAWRATTAERAESLFRCHVLPALGNRRLDKLTVADLQVWHRTMMLSLAPSTAELVVTHMRHLFAEAERDGLVQESPMRKLRVPSTPRRLVIPPTPDQVRRLHDTIDGRYRRLVVVAAATGMRQGELFGLTVDRVDPSGYVMVDRQITTTVGGGPRMGPLKTRSSVRRIPVPQDITCGIAEQVAEYGTGPDGVVFTYVDGKPIRRNRFGVIWSRAARPAGIPAGQGIHCLRHFYASLLIRSGCSVKVVQTRLGHARATETLDTYSHLWHDDDDRTRQAVSSSLPDFYGGAT